MGSISQDKRNLSSLSLSQSACCLHLHTGEGDKASDVWPEPDIMRKDLREKSEQCFMEENYFSVLTGSRSDIIR